MNPSPVSKETVAGLKGDIEPIPAVHGQFFSRYHAEAGIAAAFCLSPSFQETPWMEIADRYALLGVSHLRHFIH